MDGRSNHRANKLIYNIYLLRTFDVQDRINSPKWIRWVIKSWALSQFCPAVLTHCHQPPSATLLIALTCCHSPWLNLWYKYSSSAPPQCQTVPLSNLQELPVSVSCFLDLTCACPDHVFACTSLLFIYCLIFGELLWDSIMPGQCAVCSLLHSFNYGSDIMSEALQEVTTE